jgi:hypothetical protein
VVKSADILSFDGFATPAQCAELIGWFDANIAQLKSEWADSVFSGRVIDRPHQPTAQALARKAVALVGVGNGQTMALDTHQLVVWPRGSEQPPHIDDKRAETRFAAILYLNDDFSGGETFFEGLEFTGQPQTGRLIAFPGRRVLHGVRRITGGTRYTLALWFK